MTNQLVLVTGGSGFIALHVIYKLLLNGYRVRATLRSLNRAPDVRAALQGGGVEMDGIPEDIVAKMDFIETNLLQDDGWDEAMTGVAHVLHVASPFPVREPKNEDDLIRPAREGTLRALRAAHRAGTVRRVVITSSVAAIFAGHAPRTALFTEADWTELDNPHSPIAAYRKSKTLAERAAWDWLHGEGKDSHIQLTTVNPALVLGPALVPAGKSPPAVNSSLEIPRRMLSGAMPAIPDLHLCVVDVRDVAHLHILALESPRAVGQRYIAVSDEPTVSWREIAETLRRGLPAADTRRVPTLSAPKILISILGLFDKSARLLATEVGQVRPISNAKARQELGWRPRSAAEALLASAKSLKASGQV